LNVPKPSKLVGGLEHEWISFPYIGNNHPNWLIFLRGVGIPPTIHHLDQKEDLDLIAIVQFLNPVK
jgi:hypothetical protein